MAQKIKKLGRVFKTLIALTLAILVIAGVAYALAPNYFCNPKKMSQAELEDYTAWICSLDSLRAERFLLEALEYTENEIDKRKVASIFAAQCRLETLRDAALEFTSENTGMSYGLATCLAQKMLSPLSVDGHAGKALFFRSSPGDLFYDALLTRLEQTQEKGSVHDRVLIGDILGAMTRVVQWKYAELQTSPEDIERRIRLITAYLTSAEPSAELIAAQDKLLVVIMRDGGGTDSFFAQHPSLITGAVGEASIDLLRNWQIPARAEQAMELMQALWELEHSTDSSEQQDFEEYEALSSEMNVAVSSLLRQGSPQQQADLRMAMLAVMPPGDIGESDASGLEEALLATVPEWSSALPSLMAQNIHAESILAVYHALGRRDRSMPLLSWHREAVDELFVLVKNDEVDSTLRGYAARLLIMVFAEDQPLSVESMKVELEAMVAVREKQGKVSLPETEWEIASEILRYLPLLNPKTTVFRDYNRHYETLPVDYKCNAAVAAVEAPEAPGAAEYWIKAFTDQQLRALRNHTIGGSFVRDSTGFKAHFRLEESKKLRDVVESYVDNEQDRERILSEWDAQKKNEINQ
jgi:hypothetical protein